MRITRICLVLLVNLQILHHATAKRVNPFERIARLSREIANRLLQMETDTKFDTFLKIHLITVQAISNMTTPVLFEMKERSKSPDMRTIRQSKYCVPKAEKHIDELARVVYNKQINNCTKDFLAKYREQSYQMTELHYEVAQIAECLHHASQWNKSYNRSTCSSPRVKEVGQKLVMLDDLAKSEINHIRGLIEIEFKNIAVCVESLVPRALHSKLLDIKDNFFSCLGGTGN